MFHSVTTRLIAWSLLLTGGVYLTTIGLSNRTGRRAAIAAAEREAAGDTDAAALEVEGTLSEVEESVAALARAVAELRPEPTALIGLVQRFTDDHRDMIDRYDVHLADAAPAAPPPWYRETLQRGTGAWTEPYLSPEVGGAAVMTWAMPIRGVSGAPEGVAAASLRLSFLSAAIRKVQLGQTGFALALSRRRVIVAHSSLDRVDALIDPLATLPPDLRAQVEPIVQRAESGESGFTAIPLNGRMFRLTMRPIGTTGGIVATGYAEDELLSDVSSLQRTQILLSASGLVLLAGAIVLISRRITGPLRGLAAGAGRLAMGDLDAALPSATSRDEVGALTDAFRNMRDSLKVYIRDLQQTTAAKERIEGEVEAARRIQADMLPPATAGGGAAGYELSAVLEPARAVGGDLFDHFEHEGRVFFLVGDVSGKGVPAALFMARTKTLFDGVATIEHDPGAVLATLNRSLCRQNEAGMFVTAVCGVLDPASGEVTFATAGHDPPVMVEAGGRCGPVDTEGGLVLGLLESGDYPVSRMRLEPGDALVMYTDGVSEAQDPEGQFFGAERVLAATRRDALAGAATITNGLLRDVKGFARGAPQSDDITILTMKRTRT
ncbi:MAG: SpoIIE family protein phosphatase [Acidobacteriota bacterium]|nr:SpoIIE family protein phosphatase [Acidobacteriota bacterium]